MLLREVETLRIGRRRLLMGEHTSIKDEAGISPQENEE